MRIKDIIFPLVLLVACGVISIIGVMASLSVQKETHVVTGKIRQSNGPSLIVCGNKEFKIFTEEFDKINIGDQITVDTVSNIFNSIQISFSATKQND